MHARIVSFQPASEHLQDVATTFRERVLPMMQQQPGFKNVTILLDRQRGRVLGLSLWESAEVADAAMQALDRVRSEGTASLGASTPAVEAYEVLYHG